MSAQLTDEFVIVCVHKYASLPNLFKIIVKITNAYRDTQPAQVEQIWMLL